MHKDTEPMNGESSALKTALQSILAATRKGAALVVVTPWEEVWAMLAGAILVAILVVAATLVVGAAAVLVIPVAVPAAALVLALVGLVKMAVRTAGDE